MVTNAKPQGYSANVGFTGAFDLRGLSTDTKPTNVPNGSTFLEMDSGDVYIFDADNTQWRAL